MQTEEQSLIEKLRRIDALFSRPGTEGERVAAERARERILQRLAEVPRVEPEVEFRFKLVDPWSQRLLLALLRRHGIRTFRKRGQRRDSIMALARRSFVDEVLWPQFREFERELREYFDRSTERIIERALGASVHGR